MCGIYGHIKKKGSDNSLHLCLEGLRRLEYRGYDSAGIAGHVNGKLLFYKAVGKVSALDTRMQKEDVVFNTAIAHTRWATHGGITETNAHPHFDQTESIALVHNGIIENYQKLKKDLKEKGIAFASETDTEVIAQLIQFHYTGDITEAVQKTLPFLHGLFAIALIHKDHPDVIVTAVRGAPMAVGVCHKTEDLFISSDPNAFAGRSLDVLHLQDDEIAHISPQAIDIFDKTGALLTKQKETLHLEKQSLSKEGFEHFLIKEIYEQPFSIDRALRGRIDEENGTAHFQELTLSDEVLQNVDQVLILACGSSYHAGYIAASIIESYARIPTRTEIASEFRYIDPVLSERTLVIAISQSGETADTLGALRQMKSHSPIIALCNVKGSLITRLATNTLFLHAGPEISVCSTKAFTSQLTVLLLLALKLGRLRGVTKEQGLEFTRELKQISSYVSKVLEQEKEIATYAKKYAAFHNFFFIGRKQMYPTCLEAALKFKEISYLHAVGYPAGELKHGPIALISPDVPTIAFCGNRHTYDKLIGNLTEIKSRGGPILAFVPEEFDEVIAIVDDYVILPSGLSDPFLPIPYSVAGQLFAYHIAKILGTDIDQPRNLAKSVTVE